MKRKRIILIVSLCAVFVVALTLSLLGKFVFGWFDEKETPYVPPVLEDGEAYYYFAGGTFRDVVLMYPQLSRDDIGLIRVHNTKGENYFFYHEQSGASSYFLLGSSKNDRFTDTDIYYPPILGEWSGAFDYATLYDDESTMPMLLAAVGAVRIGERLRPEDGNFSDEWLSHYGLAVTDNPAYFEIVPYLRDGSGKYIYTDGTEGAMIGYGDDGKFYRLTKNEDGSYTRGALFEGNVADLKPQQDPAGIRRVYVGSRTVDDTGYYMRLEGRNTVYTTTTASVSDVVNRNVGYYVAPRLVTKAESNYSYQITPNLSVYRGHRVDEIGAAITELMSLGLNVSDLWVGGGGGGLHIRDQFLQADLTDADFAAFLDAFRGAGIGDTRDVLVRANSLAEIGGTVSYRITGIPGFYDAATHRYHDAASAGGRTVSKDDTIVVSYRRGDDTTDYVGLIDLTLPELPVAVRTDFTGRSFGTVGGEGISFRITYDDSTEYATETVTVGLVEISAIIDRATGETADKAAPGCDVTLRFYRRRGENYTESESVTLRLPTKEETDDDDRWLELNGQGQSVAVLRLFAELVTGRGVTVFDNGTAPEREVTYAVEYVGDFSLYLGATATYGNAYEETLTFGYNNRSNAFFGSSRFQIKSPENRTLYGLDSAMAISVLREFQDMVGDETVALGLDAGTMEKYGLYAYRVYYEMPFDCYTVTRKNDIVDYFHKTKIGYELFISEKQEDGSRYVASTQFDNVVKVKEGVKFDFAEWDFTEHWAQSNLLLVSYEDLRSLVVDLNFSDGGDYSRIWAFDTAVDRAYRYSTTYLENGVEKVSYTTGSRLYASLVDGGAHRDGLTSEQLRAVLRYTSDRDKNAVTCPGKLVLDTETGRYQQLAVDFRALDEIYGNRTSAAKPQYYDGATNFQTMLQIMNTTYYFGNVADELTDAEVAALVADPRANVMTLAFTMRDGDNRETRYTIRFYTYSQHTLVSITDDATGAETHDFYIQTREVYKIAEAVVALTKGTEVDNNRY